ncbi:hypothetical protein D9613_007220 [Agrocybe pediades]|uniref:Uncharacterized protein n=1 Tax=Agrocybe pediades TaxID=84607 RepID=A0A8H4VJS5_9AGAR|nr:hypothetical protein D9613_007220 [Agrocybe pediades]
MRIKVLRNSQHPALLAGLSPMQSGEDAGVEVTNLPNDAHPASAIQTLTKRELLPEDGSLIILIDVIVLFLLFGSTIVFAISERFRRRREQRETTQKNNLPLNPVGDQREEEQGLIDIDASLGMENKMEEGRVEGDSNNADNPIRSSNEITMPAAPPPSPESSKSGSLSPPVQTSLPTTPTTNPELYGDPYPSSASNHWSGHRSSRSRSSMLSSSRQSLSSMISSKLGRATYGRFSRLSETWYPDDPALSDTRSNVLARELSKSSRMTVSTVKGSHFRSRSDADSEFIPDEHSPTVPPLAFRHGDLPSF